MFCLELLTEIALISLVENCRYIRHIHNDDNIVGDTALLRLDVSKLSSVEISNKSYLQDDEYLCSIDIDRRVNSTLKYQGIVGPNTLNTFFFLNRHITRIELEIEHVCDEQFGRILKYCTQLHSVNVFACPMLTHAAIDQVADHCQHITEINMSVMCDVDDGLLRLIEKRGHALTAIHAMAKHCPQLTLLDVSRDPQVSDPAVHRVTSSAIAHVIQKCTKLRTLLLRGCRLVNSMIFPYVSNFGTKLRVLVITSCHKSCSNRGLLELKTDCPLLTFAESSKRYGRLCC